MAIIIIYVIAFLYVGYKQDWKPVLYDYKYMIIYVGIWTVGTLKMALWELKYDGIMDYIILISLFIHILDVIYREIYRNQDIIV